MRGFIDYWREVTRLDAQIQKPKYRYWPYCNPNLVLHDLELCRSAVAKCKAFFGLDWYNLENMNGRLGHMIVRQNLETGHIVIFEPYDYRTAQKFKKYVNKYGRYPNVPTLHY